MKDLRPACAEIIICTGLKTRGGMQVWGSIAQGHVLRPPPAGVTALSPDVQPVLRRPDVH